MTNPSEPIRHKRLQQTPEAMLRYQQSSFHELLQHVWKHSSFYRDYYGSCGIREEDLPHLCVSDLPFLSKKTLMENFDRAVTDPRLKKKELEQWIQEVPNPGQLYRDHFIVLHTSGSSGDIAIFVYDLNAWRLMNVTVTKNLPPPENLLGGKTRVACYLALHGHFAGVTTAALLPRTVYDVLVASLLDATERVVKQLNEFQPHRIAGYPSSVAMLADLALRGTLRIHPQTLLVGGEVLTETMKQKIQSAWGAPICEMYSASESIYLAIRAWGEENMMVVNDLNILEVLDQDHRAVSPGQSGRVVLTNLYNYVLPILRYELGDYAIRGQGRLDAPITTIRGIQGRVNDALPVMLDNGKRDTIHPIILSEFYAAGLENVQFISRRPDHVEIHYVAPQNIDDSARREFQRILELKGAVRTTFDVRRVEQIDLDPRTGKLPLVKLDKEPEGASEKIAHVRSAQLPVEDALPEDAAEHPLDTDRFSVGGYDLQQALIAKCFHPSGNFVEFKMGEIEQSIPARFEQVVLKYPDRIAVKTGDRSLTYNEVNRAANRVAGALLKVREEGTEPVALHLDHGADLIAAILGVLKAGKIFLYLDPSYPDKRIADILEDSQLGLIVTDNKNRQRLKELAPSSIAHLNIDDLDPSLSTENPNIMTSPEALAWLLYTSGSTGRPKGVVHNHRNLLHNIMTYTNSMHICTHDRLSLLHSCNVITSVKNLLGALLNGAAVYPFNVREEGLQRLIAWMIQEGITVYHAVPSLFRHFSDALTGEKKFPKLRLIALGSEPVSKRDVEQYKRHFSSDCILVNLLGNTEMGTYRQYFVDKTTPITSSIVPAGFAVEDKEIHLLDDAGGEVSPGDVGEIAVKSRYLAVGYWRAPDATKASFVADPNGGDERIYLTGDLGRMATDGCLTYLGRKDFQVKMRGHRVDLAEIEMVLLDHAGVKDAVVVAHDDPRNEKRLVAYVVQNQTGTPPGDGLRNFMESRLPDYMVPSVLVRLDRLPISPDGKVDRQALPVPDWTESKLGANFVLPRNHLEKTIAGIWQEMLQLEKVGIHDNFFDLGGHSLLAMQIISKVLKTLQVELSVRSVFEVATVAGLAKLIETIRWTRQGQQHTIESKGNREQGDV
jgi:amino acid adenylation domain-containing protein